MILLILFLLSIGLNGMEANYTAYEKSLRNFLLIENSYDVDLRPVNTSRPLVVNIDVALNHLVDVNEKNQYMHCEIWNRVSWHDYQLSWVPGEYGGINVTHIPIKKLWRPDLILYNEIGLESGYDRDRFLAIVEHTGKVSWHYPKIVLSYCKLDVSEFPFDEQTCPLKFGSWAMDGTLLALVNTRPHGDKNEYEDNGEWELVEIAAEQHKVEYVCCPDIPYYDVTFYVKIRRRPLYYTYSIVFPCVCLTFLCVAGFLLPVQSGERISMNLMILLAQVVFLLFISEIMPEQSEVVPVIGVYVGACIALISTTTLLNILTVYIYFRGTRGRRMPKWMRQCMLQGCARILGYRNMLHAERFAHEKRQHHQKTISEALRTSTQGLDSQDDIRMQSRNSGQQQGNSSNRILLHRSTDDLNGIRATSCRDSNLILSSPYPQNTVPTHRPSGQKTQSTMSVLGGINANPNRSLGSDNGLLKHHLLTSQIAEDEMFNEWRVLSFVLDRIFFVLYLILAIIITLYILV